MAVLHRFALALFISSIGEIRAAYNGPSCPSPCVCLKFQGLWSAYCNRTGIQEVPKGIPANTQLLDLSENNIQHIPKDAFSGLNDLQELDLALNGLVESSISPGALDLPNLVAMELSGNMFSTIPKYLPRNITTLWFLYNKLTTLTDDSFVNYRDLNYLDVSNNHLSTIEPLAFSGLTKLQTLYVPFNKLTDSSFPSNIFAKNVNLQLLSLRFNQLQHLLHDLPMSLQHLDYVGNHIKTLPAYGFQSLPNLQTLELWEGQVTTLEDHAFLGLSSLTILDFMQDKISSPITNKTFTGLTGLQTLYLDINNISTIEAGALRPLESISSLWLGGNNLSHLEPEVLNEKYLSHLSELYIDFNPWFCDCHLRWLREKVDNATYVIQDPHLITCAGPPKLAGKAWDVLKPNDFVC